MKQKLKIPLFILLIIGLVAHSSNVFSMSKNNDPNLQWWQQARFGMFIHWGPGTRTGGEISWMRERYGKSKYDSLYLGFNPVKFNPMEWVNLAKKAIR